MGVIYRQAEEQDADAMDRDLKNATGRTFNDELNDQRQGMHSIHIALQGNQIVGGGFIRWLGPRDSAAMRLFPKAPEILRLDVREDQRSRGIGSRLIREMEEQAANFGYTAISLGVSHQNPMAYRLYKRLGFSDTEVSDYIDAYSVPAPNGGLILVEDRCRYMVKWL